jgi:hypothetical protein
VATPVHTLARGRRLGIGALALAALGGGVLIGACGGAARPPLPKLDRTADLTRARANAVTVSPFPGTVDASARTQISFLGDRGTSVSDVRATGSISGRHAGRLEPYSTGTGESFIADKPFVAGEHVRVQARVMEASGVTTTARTSFTIAYQAPVSQEEFANHTGNPDDVQHYRSAPSLTPSIVRVTTPAQPGATPGELFLAPYQGAGSPGPMIADQSGNLVWFHPLPPGDSATNFRRQTYDGHTVLTWWQGRVLKLGFGQGRDEIYNTSYQPIARVDAGNGYHADLHEFLLTSHGTAWVDAFDPVLVDLSALGGSPRGVVTDSVIQEIDVKTGLVMWEWHALGHIPLRDTYSTMPHLSIHYWDYAHINSIAPGPDGQLLLSSRSTWAVYDVNMHTGGFRWRIGGKFSSFKREPGTKFYWQHDAAWQRGGLVSLFDNGSSPPEEKQSRGLVLDPDTATKTVKVVREFTDPDRTLLASSQGDLLNLGDGNWLMGYGGLPDIVEYSSSGRVLLAADLGLHVQDFRTYLAAWSATPKTRPAIAAQSTADGATVEASWNGATGVGSWRVLAGSSLGRLTPVATAPRRGFETTIAVGSSAAYVAVSALDSSGRTLATSRAITPGG